MTAVASRDRTRPESADAGSSVVAAGSATVGAGLDGAGAAGEAGGAVGLAGSGRADSRTAEPGAAEPGAAGPGAAGPGAAGPGSAGPGAAGPGSAEQHGRPPAGSFHVRLDNFDGPFDLLLQLISAQRMDITEVALHRVTDDFIAHIRAMGTEWDLGQATEFLVVAATLLDLKTARLLPGADAVDPEDIALLESRDLLFARLLAYRAYQQVADLFAELQATALRRYPRAVTLEDRFLNLLPEVRIGLGAAEFAALATEVFAPKPPPPAVSIVHVHSSPESVAEHTAILVARLQHGDAASFADLVDDCTTVMQVIARFLGLLNLFRNAAVAFDQQEPLGPLTVRWIGSDDDGDGAVRATDEEYE